MARIIRNLKIDDVSSVDVGAGRGVRVVLTKRDGEVDSELRRMLKNDAMGRPHRKPADQMAEKLGEGGLKMSGSKTLKCPSCGDTFNEDEAEAVDKRVHDIHKATGTVLASILSEMQSDNKLTKREAAAAIGGHADMDRDSMRKLSELHRAEMKHRLGLARD